MTLLELKEVRKALDDLANGKCNSTDVNQVLERLIHEGEDSDGAMIAIKIPDDIREQIKDSVADDETYEDLHVTLLYLGDLDQLSVEDIKSIKEVLQEITSNSKMLEIGLHGVGKFASSPSSDGKIPYFYLVNAKGLNLLQAKIQESVYDLVGSKTDFGWVPHLTLGYAEEQDIVLPDVDRSVEWECSSIHLVLGPDWIEYKLKGN